MKSLLLKGLSTSPDVTPLILRLTLGIVMLPHGLQKTFGLFGGHGFSASVAFFTSHMGIPWIFAVAAILAESLGALFLLLGLLTRLAALAVGIEMIVAVIMVHAPNGFFMNWSGSQKGEGFEYHLLALGIVLALLIRGGGLFSLDRALRNASNRDEKS